MRIVTFHANGDVRLGLELGDVFIDANRACACMLKMQGDPAPERLANALLPSDPLSFLQAGARAMDEARRVLAFVTNHREELKDCLVPASSVKRLAPVPRPGKIICVGRNYYDHVSEMKRDLPRIPVIFAKLQNTVCAHGDVIPFPRVSDQLDYEAELAVIIGKRGRDISQEKALEYIAGYTAYNDITVRDWQQRTSQWLQGKSFDKTGPMGPALVTVEDIPDPQNLSIRLWLNGELRQDDTTRNMIFSVAQLISFISQVMTLEPGDVIATGTPGGVGVAMDPKGFMKVGDVVRVEIERIGVLENCIGEA
ncbi:fumarylacetoacetate hydrolase family protein [Alicyclobacillus acidocaldarius]|uniref:2-hydroxyhepta-2,4-diene-1,7-dioate isomerase n=1 Tax=Alicyclobacillus acidocaldarius (strain Tc-4-1) TaxID=1048834 RepID=F8ICT0_ALIAT|nr:fumarylacetoacetate hydrolase family protein [Alicyclobacillus acidocaldarius]AEJ43745.1 2-hydroxyhepta-2,4-diene-1,7-dioate isomerase [Alicyclobacillus acidocaldarius subsp. acidocaldarius Tc-4-1]